MPRFEPCTSCHRHVRADAEACPFCSAAHTPSSVPAPALATGRLTRAAVFAGAALVGGAVAAASACAGPETKTATPVLENGAGTADAAPAEGPPDAAEVPAVKEEPFHHQQPMPYGAPPARDRWV